MTGLGSWEISTVSGGQKLLVLATGDVISSTTHARVDPHHSVSSHGKYDAQSVNPKEMKCLDFPHLVLLRFVHSFCGMHAISVCLPLCCLPTSPRVEGSKGHNKTSTPELQEKIGRFVNLSVFQDSAEGITPNVMSSLDTLVLPHFLAESKPTPVALP